MIHAFENHDVLANSCADYVAQLLRDRLAANNRASVALGGGRTPRLLFAALVDQHRDTLDWSKVLFFWGDERSVGPDHADSNFRMAMETLLVPLDISESHYFRLEGEREDLDGAARAYEQSLRKALDVEQGIPVLDLILLGMGPDAHTASLFPGTTAISERERLVVANHVPKLQTHRLTMTYPLINAAQAVIFLVTGEEKAEALHSVLHGPRNNDQWPAQGVNNANVEWWVGAECTRKLPS